jgi:hypothetical protein
LSSSPVEMRTLQAPAAAHEATNTTGTTASAPIATFTPHVLPPKDLESAQLEPAKPPATLNRAETGAIGPSTDTPAAMPDNTHGPVLVIMLLLISGARHPYKIEKKYLQKRKVDVEDWDPYKISVYTLKELIWRDWREGTYGFIHVVHKSRRVKSRRVNTVVLVDSLPTTRSATKAFTRLHQAPKTTNQTANWLSTEWEARPTSPSSIRLIHFGRMLDDKSPLKGSSRHDQLQCLANICQTVDSKQIPPTSCT